MRKKHLLRRPVWILSSAGVLLVAVLLVLALTAFNGGLALDH